MTVANTTKPQLEWFRDAAKLMVRAGMSLKMAATELQLDLDARECERILYRKEFQKVLGEEREKFYAEVAATPGRSKATAIGRMHVAIERLASEGAWDKVITGVRELARLEGWVGPETDVTVFAGLTAKDIAEAKERLKARAEADLQTTDRLPN